MSPKKKDPDMGSVIRNGREWFNRYSVRIATDSCYQSDKRFPTRLTPVGSDRAGTVGSKKLFHTRQLKIYINLFRAILTSLYNLTLT